MLFKVSSQPLFEENPEIKAIPAFEELTEMQMRYVILAYDYKTPFRQLPPEQRKEKAAVEAGYKMEPDGKRLAKNGREVVGGKVDSINAAVRKYIEIQYDVEKETLVAFDNQLEDFRRLFNKKDKSDKEFDLSLKIMKEYPKIVGERKKLIEALGLREEMEEKENQNQKPLSLLDEVD